MNRNKLKYDYVMTAASALPVFNTEIEFSLVLKVSLFEWNYIHLYLYNQGQHRFIALFFSYIMIFVIYKYNVLLFIQIVSFTWIVMLCLRESSCSMTCRY